MFPLRLPILLLVALSAAVASAAPASEPEPERPGFTLEQAVVLGARNSAAIIQAQGAVRSAAAARRSAWGAYLPRPSLTGTGSVSSSTRFNPQTNLPSTGSSNSVQAGAAVTWDLFTGGRRGAEQDRARAQSTVASSTLVQQERSVTYLVTQAFYEALRGEQLTAVARSRIQRAKVGYAAAEKRALVGSSTRSDVLRAALEVNSASSAELEALNTRDAAELQLGQYVGLTGPARAVPAPGEYDVTPLVVPDSFVEEVVEALPELRAARASVDAARASVRSAQAAYWPTLRLSAGYDWFTQNVDLANGRTSWSGRLGVSLPLFDGFVREETIVNARVTETTVQGQLAELLRTARSELGQAVNRLRLANNRLELTTEAASVAREDLRVQQERYNQGLTTMLEFLTSQENLVTAETDQVGARFDREIARAEVEALSGRSL